MEGQEQAERSSSNEGATLELLETVQNDWRGLKEHPLPAICRVPQTIRVVDPVVYKPRVVSIGPYHYKPADQDHHELEAGQKLKQRFLQNFLGRNKDVSLKDYIELIQGLEPEARKHYKEDVTSLSSKEFNNVMLLDGCFILEIFLKKHGFEWISYHNFHHGNNVIIEYAYYDLLLVENQLPWFIIDKIYTLFTNKRQCFPKLSSLALQNFEKQLTDQFGRINKYQEESEGTYYHLLHLIHAHIYDLYGPLYNTSTSGHVLSASKLHEEGVKFVKPDEGTGLFEISYRNGNLILPQLIVTDASKPMFHNFIAFEQLYPGYSQYFTTYASFMRYLITSTKDIDVLEKSGLLDWRVGSNEDIAIFFSQFMTGTVTCDDENYLSSTYSDLIEHCKVRRHGWIAKLKQDYFGNPWSIISLVAAIVLILLTGLQTFFAIFSYFRPPHIV